LTHVVQQGSSRAEGPLAVGSEDGVHEHEADPTAELIPQERGPAPITRQAPESVLQRISFGTDGTLTPTRKAITQQAGGIAQNLVMGPTFRKWWEAFWKGPAVKVEPKPTLEQYQAAVRNRVMNSMDSSSRPDVRAVVQSEQSLPLERQTAAVTRVGEVQTYMRDFAIDQGVESVASTILHESLHGAGLPMGPAELYEPLFHQFEADVGFPMMMGGADIIDISKVRNGDLDVDVTITYRLRRIGNEPLPKSIEIQVVDASSGEVLNESPDGTGKPGHQIIPSNVGQAKWSYRARNRMGVPMAVRIRDLTAPVILASRDFTVDPRCVLGVSTMHCEGEK
jgi:hypothetical protein